MYDEQNTSTVPNEFQTYQNYHSVTVCLLRSSRIHICQAKLLVRRARAASIGPDYNTCLKQLLQGLERVNTSLAWLTSNEIHAANAPPTPATELDLIAAGGAQ